MEQTETIEDTILYELLVYSEWGPDQEAAVSTWHKHILIPFLKAFINHNRLRAMILGFCGRMWHISWGRGLGPATYPSNILYVIKTFKSLKMFCIYVVGSISNRNGSWLWVQEGKPLQFFKTTLWK